MSGNSKHSKNNLNIYVIILRDFILYGGCTDIIVFFYIQLINHHIYFELSCYLIKTPMMLRFSANLILY